MFMGLSVFSMSWKNTDLQKPEVYAESGSRYIYKYRYILLDKFVRIIPRIISICKGTKFEDEASKE